MIECILVGVGGFLGSICRYLVGKIPLGAEGGFPYKTLGINVLGAFVLASVAALAARDGRIGPRVALMLKVGVCGGFTTFSTFSLDTAVLWERGQSLATLAYVLGSVVVSIGALVAGLAVVRTLVIPATA